MSFLQLVLSLDKTIKDLILFCRQCHSDPYRNTVYLYLSPGCLPCCCLFATVFLIPFSWVCLPCCCLFASPLLCTLLLAAFLVAAFLLPSSLYFSPGCLPCCCLLLQSSLYLSPGCLPCCCLSASHLPYIFLKGMPSLLLPCYYCLPYTFLLVAFLVAAF